MIRWLLKLIRRMCVHEWEYERMAHGGSIERCYHCEKERWVTEGEMQRRDNENSISG